MNDPNFVPLLACFGMLIVTATAAAVFRTLAGKIKEGETQVEFWKALCELRAQLNQEMNRKAQQMYDLYEPKWQWEEPIDPEGFTAWQERSLDVFKILDIRLPLLVHPDFTFKVGRDGITPLPKEMFEAKDGNMVQPKDGEQWLIDHKKE